MELRSVEFYNFGPFKGLQTLDIDPTAGLENRPLTLVRAYNDVGKTSILKALNFCLYGFGSHRSPNASVLRARAINRQAALENDGEMFVKMKFRNEGDDYSIRRSINFKKTDTFAEEPEINKYTCVISKNENNLFDQESVDEGFWDSINDFVENILPEDVAQFFFFDGEKIQNYAQEKPTPAITTAVQKILGIQQILNAKKDTMRNLSELNSRLTDAQSDDSSIKEEADELRKKKEDNENLKKKIDEDNATIISLEDNIRINGAIVESATGIKEDWDKRKELEDIEKKLITEIKKSREEKKQFNDTKLLSHLLSLVFEDTNSNTNQIPRYVSKASKWCLDKNNCLCHREITDSVSATLTEMSSTSNNSREAEEEEIYSEISREYGKTLPENLSTIALRASDLDARADINEEALIVIKEKIGDATETQEGKIKSAKEQYDRDTTAQIKTQAVLDADTDRYENEKKHLDRQDEELTARSKSTKVHLAQANVVRCKQIIDALSEIIDSYVESEREDIQKRMSEYFLSITNKPEVYKEVILDENYRIKLRVPEGTVDVWKLSASSGASAMISFAFIAALNSKAVRQAPIVIDTPTGRLDPIHSAKIIKFWPKFGRQVIILYQPNEISDNKLIELEDLIAYHYECKPKLHAEEESYIKLYGDEN
jgi:DNA sulfur modification protein DndD